MSHHSRDLRQAAAAWTGEDSAAHRHLGIAGLNLATEAGPRALLHAADGLRFLAAHLSFDDDPSDVDALTSLLVDEGLLPRLDPAVITRRLRAAATDGDIRRAPESPDLGTPPLGERRRGALDELRCESRALARYFSQETSSRRAELLDDGPTITALLSHQPPAILRKESLYPWDLPVSTEPLRLLTAFESAGFDRLPDGLDLGDRARRFEQSLATHLAGHGLLPAIRAALAFAPPQPGLSPREINRFLVTFDVLADDQPLREPAVALVQIHGVTLRVLRGLAPLSAMAPWIDYLRSPCADFAEGRGMTLREATNFAHYALHLMNLMELAARRDLPSVEPVRAALLDLEEELKEFALAGQREGLTDRQADLHRYDRGRFATEEPSAALVDRIARLCGSWRNGHRPGPPGGRPRQNHPVVGAVQQAVDTTDRTDLIDAATHLMGFAELGDDRLCDRPPEQVLRSLLVMTSVLRDLDGLDRTRPFRVDGLSPSMDAPESLIAHVAAPQQVSLRLHEDPEWTALRELLRHTDDPRLTALLEERLAAFGHREAPSPSPDDPADEDPADGHSSSAVHT